MLRVREAEVCARNVDVWYGMASFRCLKRFLKSDNIYMQDHRHAYDRRCIGLTCRNPCKSGHVRLPVANIHGIAVMSASCRLMANLSRGGGRAPLLFIDCESYATPCRLSSPPTVEYASSCPRAFASHKLCSRHSEVNWSWIPPENDCALSFVGLAVN